MRRTLSLAALLVAVPATLAAQDKTLLGNGISSSGGMGGPVLKVSKVAGTSSIFMGGRGGWVINRKFILGGGGWGLTNENIRASDIGDGRARLQMGYGGLELGYMHDVSRLVHWSGHLLLGGGGASWDPPAAASDNEETSFAVVEPELHLVLNVTSFFRIGAGASYRVVTGPGLREVSGKDLSGAAGVLVFKFGAF
ncbi:MAG: hypothetical protein KF709_11930 [Gemmatimonadaceae bacterium]|nr:hypothetical protein [Gemmatimonadaceae bacterium]